MNIVTVLSGLIKSKIVVTTVAATALLTVSGVALASTPTGNEIVQQITNTHATVTPTHEADKASPTAHATEHNQNGNSNSCPGQHEAQQLATKFALSTDSKGSAMKVICTLHDGSFQGTVDGKSVTIDHALGYGEIDQLLTYAQSLAAKKGEKLTNSNVQNYVATALKACGSTPVVPCINDNGGKPASTPTPHADDKPESTPTPHADDKPESTPTPHANK
jgi:hypothetical protein